MIAWLWNALRKGLLAHDLLEDPCAWHLSRSPAQKWL